VIPTFGSVAVASPAGANVTSTGTGSSYAAIAIEAWVSQIFNINQTSINYQASSSVIGLQNFAQNLVDFGASEIGYSAGQTSSSPTGPYQYLPDVAGATCLMYNVIGQTGQQVQQLQLSPAAIAGIFTGQITKWNSPVLAALNPSALLPNQPIIVTARGDASGDNYIFSDYVQTTQPSVWQAFTAAMGVGNGPTAIWPTPTGAPSNTFNESKWVLQNGSDSASNYVASSPYTITYVEAGYAQEHNLPCAYVENQSGNYVRPSELGDAIALTNDTVNVATGEQSLANVFNAGQAGAYPISAYSYLVTPTSNISPAKGAVLSAFILFLACQGQQSAGTLGYSPLPTNLVGFDFTGIEKINGHVPVPSAINAQTCPNPYINGQLQSQGEPPLLGAPQGGGFTGQITVGAAGGGSQSAAATAAASAKSQGTGGAAAILKRSSAPGGGSAAAGQTAGVALVAASSHLLGMPGPTGQILVWTLAFLVLLLVPLAALTLARRKRANGDADTSLSTEGSDVDA